MTTFTPVQSLLGGALIGVAAVLLMALHGRIAGITGILSGLLPPRISSDWAWRASFLGGMVASPLLYTAVFRQSVAIDVTAAPILLLVSGAIVGIGVNYSSGCTSGHGVCGLARFSKRSLAATVTFMATAAATVFVVRHVVGV